MSNRFLISAALVLATVAVSTLPLAASSRQVSAGQAFSDIDLFSTLPQISPNGVYAVYIEDAVTDGANELWSARLDGATPPVRLSNALTPGRFVTFAISSDSTRVVYSADQDTPGRVELYSVPIAGGAKTKLSPPLGEFRNVAYFTVPPLPSTRVFFVADAEVDQRYELYSVPIAGGAAVRINADLLPDFDVEGFRISPNGSTVVYRAGRDAVGFWELFSVPASGPPASAVKISLTLGTGSAVDPYFEISPDGSRAIYMADANIDETYDLFSVPIGGGVFTELSTGPAAGSSVEPSFHISASTGRVIFRAVSGTTLAYQLYSVPITGGTALRLNSLLGAHEGVEAGFAVTADGSKAVYRSDEENTDVVELFVVPVAGGTPTRLSAPLVVGGNVLDLAVSPDASRVVYRADQNVDTVNELFSVPIGGGGATRLNRALASGGDVANYRISANSHWVVYGADQDADAVDELLRAPIAGGAVENVSDNLTPGGDVVLSVVQNPAYAISPTNSYDVLYIADKDVNNQVELYLSGTPEEEPADDCVPDATTLCLQNDKFNIGVTWHDFQDRTGHGQATVLSNESGDFWFFNAQSNELIVKIINGCGSTGSYWVFWRALSNVEMDLVIRDTATLQTLTYHNPLGYNSNGHLDIDTIFRCDGSGPATETIDMSTDLPAPGIPQLIERQDPVLIAPCVPNGDRSICLKNGRFRVEGTWTDFNGGSGYAHLIKKNEGSGYAWFFNSNNYEMLFKLVDACSFNGNTWVSIAGLTNVAASLTIIDTWTGKVYSQQNALGVDFPTNLDIQTNLDYCGPSPF